MSSTKGSPSKRRHVSRSSASASPAAGSSTASPKRRKAVPPAPTQDPAAVPSEDEVNAVIASLALPDSNIQVAVDHDNHKNSNAEVQAYAKLAGPTWTYYVQTLIVVIGRSSEPQTEDEGPESRVQIDLGPAKVVSRRHASIQYNQDGRYWELTVLGRNGVRIDRVSHKEGTTRLYSGNVLDIGGVQMMFVLPDVQPRVASGFLRRVATQGHEPTAFVQQHPRVLPPPPPQAQQQYPRLPPQPVPSEPPAATVAYPRGVAIITRPQVRGVFETNHYMDQDLSADDAKDIKPPFSYATMITQAIVSSEEMMMSLSDIYDWIMKKYSFYRHSKSGWQNSIRHNLSLNKAFEKVPRKANEAGKGMKWQINEQYREEYIQKATGGRMVKAKGGKNASPPAVPASATGQFRAQFPASVPAGARVSGPLPVPTAQPAPVPPLTASSFPVLPPPGTATHVESDERRPSNFTTPQKSKYLEGVDPQYSDHYAPPQPAGPSSSMSTTVASPPQRYLGGQVAQVEAYTPDRGSHVGPITRSSIGSASVAPGLALGLTPARQTSSNLQLAPPSSAQQKQLPSSFMPGSSPAPFWKSMQFSSTPNRAGDFSPSKFSSPPGTAERRPDGEGLGDLQDVDLTRGFRQIGNWRESVPTPSEHVSPEKVKSL